MSGFLSRVAARAVGQAPVARPTLPVAFAGAPEASAGSGLEVIETVAERPVSRGEARRVASAAHEPAAPQLPTSLPVDTPPVVTRARRHEPAEPAHVETELPVVRAKRQDVVGRAPETETPSPTVPRGEIADAAASVAAVRASPARLESVPVPPATQAAVASARVEPPTVRVHIGRLEVRANLQDAPPQRPRRTEAPAPGTSLADYLRGRRAAG